MTQVECQIYQNSKNILINKSFHKKNKINFLNIEVNSKNNISDDYKINHSNNNNAQKHNSYSISNFKIIFSIIIIQK